MPFIGTVGKRAGSIWVKREDKNSRAESRRILSSTNGNPPVMLFPEGKILIDFTLQPYRYGAFQAAIDSKQPILPLVFLYDRSEVARWIENNIALDMFYTILRGPVKARIHHFETIVPTDSCDSAELANALWQETNNLYEPTIPSAERIEAVMPKPLPRPRLKIS